MVPVTALLLADGRLPAGDHAHSGGIEEAARQGLVTDISSLRSFLVGLAFTLGLQAAALASASAWCCAGDPGLFLKSLDVLGAEAEARTCSPAQRRTSLRRGRQLLRVARAAWPSPRLEALAGRPGDSHHAVVIGVVAAAAGLTPAAAATCAAYGTVAGPALAAVRLLGLDPSEVAALVAGLSEFLEGVAACAVGSLPPTSAERDNLGWMAQLPVRSAPLLDHLAEDHSRRQERLFAS